MPLQNRVDPFGKIDAVTSRGMFTGNRGVIHDPAARALLKRRWTTKAWIICALHHKDVRRQVMGRNRAGGGTGWTELFFLDEVTALAAGHRPCFACRRERAKLFVSCFADAFRMPMPRMTEIDARLHGERRASGGTAAPIARHRLGDLPDGSVISVDCVPNAIRAGRALRWSFGGYGSGIALADLPGHDIQVVTPATTLAVLSAGYRPAWHDSAAA
ncbi:MAG: hypothetical protein K0S21_397 [Rhizobiaceae bacterium]|jgi:hypothetical protein|nr:hypothetical protein [Rhizobiaceae bacterium]